MGWGTPAQKAAVVSSGLSPQTIEGAFRLFAHLRKTAAAANVLVAAARYLAAHAPTVRAQGQTFQIAYRLHRGERLFEAQP